MDNTQLLEILQATMVPELRKEAEEKLAQVHNILGFLPALLLVITTNEVPTPVRQAGVIYFKNLVSTHWISVEESVSPCIYEQDRALIRGSIVEAIVQSQNLIRVQLAVCLKTIIKHDFPTNWPEFADKILVNLQSPDLNAWQGALLCMYPLIRNYERSDEEQRKPLMEAMKLLLPIMCNLMAQLQVAEQNEQCASVQKQILKNFYSLINLKRIKLIREITTREMFTNWMEILRRALMQPVPEYTLQVDEDKRIHLPWWKMKKWAAYSLYRTLERYGSPDDVAEEYVHFSVWYVTTFTSGILDAILKILDQHRNKSYVAPTVLKFCLEYMELCLNHSHSWKLLKPHMFDIIEDVIFPLMCYSEADAELWKTDPLEFSRLKYDIIFGDNFSTVAAARDILRSCCKKRKCMLEHTVNICMQTLTNQGGEYNPRLRDGVFHVIGTLNRVLINHKLYKKQIDSLISQYVISEVNSPSGHMRARTFWVLQCYSGIKFNSKELLKTISMCTINSVLTDVELPVKVEAAIALQCLLSLQKEVKSFLEPHVNEVTLVLLNLIRETEIDELANVLQKIVSRYTEILMPLAIEMIEHLSITFLQILETGVESDQRAKAAMGLFDTIETVLKVMVDNSEIMAQLEKTLLRVVVHIIQNNLCEFYEEAMVLLNYPGEESISEDMWKTLEIIYQNFEKCSFDYFPKMMPVLHNFITTDTEAFVSNKNHVISIFNMAKAVLTYNSEENSEICAAKTLEVMVLQCNGKIDDFLYPCVELVLNRLSKNVQTELRSMLMLVLVAILYCNAQLLFTIFDKIGESIPNICISQHFIKLWLRDRPRFTGIHDRKMNILGVCKLLDMGPVRPNIDEIVPKLLPFCLVVFEGLRRAYKAHASECGEDSSSISGTDLSETDNSDEAADEIQELSSDEDHLKDLSDEPLEKLAQKAAILGVPKGLVLETLVDELNAYDDDDDEVKNDSDDVLYDYMTPLDLKNCPINEYVMFKNSLLNLSTTEPVLYSAMTNGLSASQFEELEGICAHAKLEKMLQESKELAQIGGYPFMAPGQVPTKFQFGA